MGATFTADASPATEEVYDCFLGVDHADATCIDCKGTGKVRFARQEQEVHVTYSTLNRWLERLDLEDRFEATAGQFTPAQCEAITKHVLFGRNLPSSLEARLDAIVSWAVIGGSTISWG